MSETIPRQKRSWPTDLAVAGAIAGAAGGLFLGGLAVVWLPFGR